MSPILLPLLLWPAVAPPDSAAAPDPRPRVLVIQRALGAAEPSAGAKKGGGLTDYPFATLLGGQIEATRRVTVVVWSDADPLFRAAIADGKIAPTKSPTDDEVRKVGRALGARYVLTSTCGVSGDSATGSILLQGDATYRVTETSRVSGTGGGPDLAVESVVRTLVIRLESGPFKPLLPLPEGRASARGQLDPPGQIAADDPPIPLADAPAQADRLISEGRSRAAVILLRDAVDADPFDSARRIALISALRRAGLFEDALGAARTAVDLLPDSALRIECARVLLAAGRADEARTMLNEALARDAKAPGARVLLAEIALRAGDPAAALPHLEALLAAGDPKDNLAAVYRLRSVARALLGGAEGVELDWKRAEAGPSVEPDAIEGELFSIVDDALATEGPTLRLLFQKATLRRDASEVADGLEAQERLVASLATFTRLAGRSVRFAPSREARTLGLNLLRQALGEVRSYVASGKAEDIGDARLSLGEALRNLAIARASHVKLLTQG